jgi:multidrug efflux pump subunit AcrA (membrane-fusion protein)
MKRALIVIGIVVVIAAVAVAGGLRLARKSEAKATTTTVATAVQADSVVADGMALPVTRAELSFAAAGRVTAVAVKAGDTVTAGQVLARLDDSAASSAVAAADAQVAAAEATVAQMKAGVDSANASLKKARATKDGLSSHASDWRFDVANADIAAAKAQVAAAQAQVEGAEAQSRNAKAGAEQARATLADLNLTAPFAGTVTDVLVKAGDETSPSVVAIRVADLSQWKIDTTDLNEASIAGVKLGATVELTFDALPGVRAAGKVTEIGLVSELYQGTTVYPVTVAPDVPIEGLRWGMTATVTIKTGQ